ncbi:hypothetical protein PENTCL1PPCAC_29744, partial [Pristionchus entomophagus]
GGTSPTSGQTIPNETPYHPQVQQNRPPWQQPPGTAGPPIGAIHPISPTGHQGGPAPIAGMTPGPYQPGEYRPSFGTPYPYTPGWMASGAPSTMTPTTTASTASASSGHPTDATPTASIETTTEQVFIPVGTETRTSTETTLTPTGSTITTESPVKTSSAWTDEAAHEAFRNDCGAGEIDRVRELHGHDIDCPCGPGQMRKGSGDDAECQEVRTSSVVVNAVRLCDDDQTLNDDDRALVTLREILIDVVCGGSCTLDQMTYDYAKSPESRTGRTLHFEVLSGGPCSSTVLVLHDCEKPAECVNHGLQWRCHCPRGYNDTSEGRGRRCEWAEEGMAIECIQLLGICLIWWLAILFLALLFILGICCLAWYLATRYCCGDRGVEPGYTQTRIKVPKNVKIRPAEVEFPNVKNLMVKNAKGSVLRGTVAMAQSKSLSTKSSRKSNLVLPEAGGGTMAKSVVEIVSSDEENMGIPKPGMSGITVDSPAIQELPAPLVVAPIPVKIDVTPGTPQRNERVVSMREVSGTPPPTAPTPPPPMMPTAFAAAHAGSLPILTAKPPTPPSSKKSLNGEAGETPIMEQVRRVISKPPTPPPRKESEPGRKTPTPPVAIDSPQSIAALPSVDAHPDAHLTVAPVDVHQNNVPDEVSSCHDNRDRSSSIVSVAGLPTIWDSFQVLGAQYANVEGSARRESSHSLDYVLNRRYPEHFAGPILNAKAGEEISTTSSESPTSYDDQKVSVETVLENLKDSAFAQKAMESTVPSAVPLPVEVFLDTNDSSTTEPLRKTSRPEDQRKSKLAEMLGVSESEPAVRKTSGFMDEHDSEALEELSRRGMQIEIPQLDTSQLDTASTTPRSTARGMRPTQMPIRVGRGGDKRNVRERKGVHGLSKDRERLVKATMETSSKGGRGRRETPASRGVAAKPPKTPSKMTSAEQRLYNFRKQQRDLETTESSSSLGYRQRSTVGTSKSPMRSISDKSFRQSGRDVFPIVQTATGLVSSRSPEPTHPPSYSRASRGGLSRPPREETGLESAFFNRLAKPKIKEHREPKLEIKGKQQLRFRRPVRQLSSISEKSAEVPSEYAVAGSGDIAMSAPSTTRRVEAALGRTAKRLLLSPPSKRRSSPPSELVRSPMGTTIIEKKLILETIFSNEGTDVDMPLTSRHESVADLKGIVIVEKKTEYSSDSMDPVPRPLPTRSHQTSRSLTGRSDSFLPPIFSSDRTSFRSPVRALRASNTSLPTISHRREEQDSNDSSSATSSDFPTPPVASSSLLEMRRASQISTIRRKIRQRQSDDFRSQADLRSVRREPRRRIGDTSRSADDLCEDCSGSRLLHGLQTRSTKAPRHSRTERNGQNGAARHSSLLSLRSTHTLSSADMSPYLGRDPHLPPKENLWWGAHVQ